MKKITVRFLSRHPFQRHLAGSAFLWLQNCFRIKCLLGTKEFSFGKSYHQLESQGSQLVGVSHCVDPLQVLRSAASKKSSTPWASAHTIQPPHEVRPSPSLSPELATPSHCTLSANMPTFPALHPPPHLHFLLSQISTNSLPPGQFGPLGKFSSSPLSMVLLSTLSAA